MGKRRDPHDLVTNWRRNGQRRAQQGKTPGMGAPTARATQRTTSLQELPLNPRLRQIQAAGGLEPDARAFSFGDCSVLVGRGPRGWHLSIAHPARYPTWDEIAEARYRLVPDDASMALILPSQAEYVNWHPNCFQLFEVERIRDPAGRGPGVADG